LPATSGWSGPCGGQPAPVRLLDLGAGCGPADDVAHHLGIGVQLDLQLQMVVGERYQSEPVGVQRRLGHTVDVSGEFAHPPPSLGGAS
jgi:hypothetical protein